MIPSGGGGNDSANESLTRSLARRVRALPVDRADLGQAERFVRDWIGSYVAGGAAAEGRILAAYGGSARDLNGRVFLAAARSHVTETDDLHRSSVTHPGCAVVPVALALGRETGARGRATLRAVLAGYEVMLRVGEALGPGHYRVFHNTATAGPFGAAAAAATLLNLDEDAWVWALGNAGTQAAGLWQFNEEGAMSKPLHAGHAATAGLRAALLAAEGLTGAEYILEGEKGVFAGLCPDPRPEAVAKPSPGWKLPETSMKPYPCCRHVHPAVDAALEIRDRLAPGNPTSVRIESYPAALDVTDRPRPRTPHEARFSIQYAVAWTLLHGRPGLGSFETSALRDSAIQETLSSIEVRVEAGLRDAYPDRWGAVVEVQGADGAVHRVRRDSATGDPDLPLDQEALNAKVRALMAWAGKGEAEQEALLAACGALPEDGPVFALP
jgi:2-methylcitrate dehydratase PrpD